MDERMRAEAVRLYRRYAIEIVEALGFCPYAERCREDGRTLELVATDAEASNAIETIAGDESIEIGLVLLPELALDAHAFHRWIESLRKQHTAVRGFAVLALEGFHPDAVADTSRPERLTPFVRRTPDPTIQLTRLSVLERVRRGSPQGTAYMDLSKIDVQALLQSPEAKRPLHERIAENNLETVMRMGVDEVRRRIDDIRRDRDESYARLRG
jgi:hypothetical protein